MDVDAKAFSYDDCRVILILYRPTTSDNSSGTMTEPTLAKTYDPKSIEANWYETWLDSGHFACAPASTATPYTIMTVSYTHLTLPTILLV